MKRWAFSWLLAGASIPKEHERFYDFLMHTTEGQPELRQFLVRKMLLHLSTPAWQPSSCPRPRPLRRGRQGQESLKVVVLIKVAARASSWRRMVRATLPELTKDIQVGCPVLLWPYFAVGTQGLDLRLEDRQHRA